MKYYDFRSDTVTQPTDRMRAMMAKAFVGDDVYEDDPTVKQLEAMSAKILDKESALFVPSGTFGNQLAILTHTKRGDEVILGHDCHIMMHEVGAAAVISGVQLRQVQTHNGNMSAVEIKHMIREEDIHYPDTGLICVENAHSCGSVIGLKQMASIYELAQKHHVPVHLDGARIFNAAHALEVEPRAIAAYSDSIMFCLSKGLCAPVGSMLVGGKTFIDKARKMRKLMGGGLRQVGFLAAAGIVALEDMVDHLSIDHENAKYLAQQLSKIDGIEVLSNRLDINMVFVKFDRTLDEQFVCALNEKGLKINGPENGEYRFVTNYWIDKEAVDLLVEAIKEYI
ncbi:threonine aldolase family protein [Fusibacter ferrireducens]|uniref:Low specificity L-threonine aldolase n=1 Tax=Fusibacter ferrireducens TaxID=2785058 RepID=A0ABR9ZWI7_9FIRM|nr:low specificity L-threonine aldolase [Fusibacter ferrireducens]MBF4694808.1 low specificity L-threonine aldolase [Fusibacter ferrireducens]